MGDWGRGSPGISTAAIKNTRSITMKAKNVREMARGATLLEKKGESVTSFGPPTAAIRYQTDRLVCMERKAPAGRTHLVDEDVADGGQPGVHLQPPQEDTRRAEQQPGGLAPLRLQPDLVPEEKPTRKHRARMAFVSSRNDAF